MSRGLLLILALVVGFLTVDVFGRRSFDSPDADISELEIQVAELLIPPPTSEPIPPEPIPAEPIPVVSEEEFDSPSEPLPTLTPTRSSSPTPNPTPFPTRSIASKAIVSVPSDRDEIAKPENSDEGVLFDALLTPFVKEAEKRRAELARTDPDYAKRVDARLNDGRINFLLFGYGETHEPPMTEKAIIGSHTIVSYDLRTRKADVISLTHDIRAPEIERELIKRYGKSLAVRLDQAYSVGGFKLMRQTLENATGLALDFQLTFKDSMLQGLVDGVFGGVEVNIPEAFDVHPFYLDGKKYDKGHFPRGLQRLNGRQVVQFIKTVPIAEGAYAKSLEHNVRKALILDALLTSLYEQSHSRLFWLKGSAFVTGELITGAITYDFDPVSLIVTNIGATTANIQRTIGSSRGEGLAVPRIGKTRYVVDPASGDGGVQWVNANAAENPISKRDIEDGVYPSLDFEVPIQSNPYGDLVTEYWTSVRQLVRDALSP